jgi:hypothetical protein
VLVRVSLEGQQIIAAVDTGAPYFVCDPEVAVLIERRLVDPLESITLTIRGVSFPGNLYRLTLELVAGVGVSAAVSATVFVPSLADGQTWPWPSFVGWTGVLERLRFAVDPEESLFYFGPLGDI